MGHGRSAAVAEYGAALPRAAAGLVDLAGFMVLAALLLALTWGKWPDIVSDYGRELYIPWRLAEGQVLYRDLFYLNGPLSPYYHALLFRVFGVSLLTLVASNLAVLALAVWLIYHIIREMSDRPAAQAAVAAFLLLFGFGHLENQGNYNWIAPYSHELTHGLVLALGMLVLLARDRERRPTGNLFLAGLFYGLVFLTKVEIFVAATAMVLAWLVFLRREGRCRAIGLFLAAAALPVAGFACFLAMQMEWRLALRGLAGGWTHLLGTPLAGQYFYRKLAGMDEPGKYAGQLLSGTLSILLLAGAAVLADYRRRCKRPQLLAVATGLCLLAAMWLKAPFPPLLAGPELPVAALLGLALGASAACQTTRRTGQPAGPWPLVPGPSYLLLWSVLALVLLLRFGLRPRLAHYGFVLALPAALLFIVLCLYHLPRFLAARYGGGQAFRRLAWGGVVVSVGFWLVLSGLCYHAKTVPVGRGGDAILTYPERWEPRDYGLAQAVGYLERHTAPGDALVVLPEGVLVNYLARRLNPTPYVSFMPAEVAIAGEDTMLAALEQARPDYLLVVWRRLTEYGHQPYGVGEFGQGILAWLDREYEIVAQFGAHVSLYKRQEVLWKK